MSILDLIPSEDKLDRMLCVAERERHLLQRLLRLARVADRMREADEADRKALKGAGKELVAATDTTD